MIINYRLFSYFSLIDYWKLLVKMILYMLDFLNKIFFKKLKFYDQELNSTRMQYKNYEDKVKQLYQEISVKEEQLIGLKNENQNIQEKFRQKSEEVKQNLKDKIKIKNFGYLGSEI